MLSIYAVQLEKFFFDGTQYKQVRHITNKYYGNTHKLSIASEKKMYKFFKHVNSDHAITVPKVIRGVPRYGADEIHSFDGYPENIPQHMFFDVQFKYI